MPLRLFGEVENLLNHVSRPMAILLAASHMLPYRKVRPDCAEVLAAGHANNWYHTSAESH